MLTLNVEKAFDRVHICNNQSFWFSQSMYKNPVSQVKFNGTLSRRFQIHQGTRQGDPLSSHIFAVCMEPLAETIRQQVNIKGITIGQETH